MPKCHFCNDEGRDGGCPKCGLTVKKVVGAKIMTIDVPTDIIPVAYQGIMWENDKTVEKTERQKSFDDTLETVYSKFLAGEIPQFSLFIAAPPKSGKNLFAYSCMQTSLAQRFSVAPLLATGDWRRLHKVSQMNPYYKLYGLYQWDELIMRDVVFVTVEHTDMRFEDVPLLKTLLDARATFGKPTFIISDYRLNDLIPKWKSDNYTMIYNSNAKRDFFRYPVILHRFE